MPSTTTLNSGRKSYLSRVLSVNGGSSRNDTNANNNTTTSTSTSTTLKRFGSGRNTRKENDELRSHVASLKTEIEVQKMKSKQIHRDKVAEVKRIKDQYERANSLSIEAVTQKMKNLNESELKKLKDNLSKDKESEIKQIIKFKDEEIKTLQKTMQDENDRLQRQFEKANITRRRFGDDSDVHKRLKIELGRVEKERNDFEEKCVGLSSSVNQKSENIRKLKVDHERELQKMLREARRENSRSISELQTLRKSLHDKDVEINKLDVCVLKISEEKDQLEEKIKYDKNKISDRSFLSSDLQGINHTKSLQAKNADLKRQLFAAEVKVQHLEKENHSLSSTGHSFELSKSFRLDSKVKQLRTRNAELVAIAKKLEEKAKQIQNQFDDYKEQVEQERKEHQTNHRINNLKQSYSKQRAKDLTDHAMKMLIKEKEIEKLRTDSPRIEERLRLEEEMLMSPSRSLTPVANDFVEDYTKLKHERDDILSEHKTLQKLHASCQITKDQLQRKSKELENVILLLQKKEEECETMSKSLMQSKQEMGLLKKEAEALDNNNIQLKQENKLQRMNVDTLEKELSGTKRKLAVMSQLEEEYSKLKGELRVKSEEYMDILEAYNQLKHSITKLNKKLVGEQEKVNDLVMENTHVQQQLCERDEEIARMHQMQAEIQTSHNNTVTDINRHLHLAEKRNQALESEKSRLVDKLGQVEKCRKTFSVAVQTEWDKLKPVSPELLQARLSSDNVFESPNMAHHPPINIKITKPTVTSSYENSEIEEEDFSIRSDNIIDYAARRIDELAQSQSDAGSMSEVRPFMFHSKGVDNAFDADDEKVSSHKETAEGGDETDDDISIEELKEDTKDDVIKESLLLGQQSALLETIPTPEEFSTMIKELDQSSDFPVKVFVAKYTYDPSLYSPNQDHEIELPLYAGERIYVYGEMDEDGFYMGEVQAGRRGLVPSNLIERIHEDYVINDKPPFDVSDSDLSEVKRGMTQKNLQQDGRDSPLAAEYLERTNQLKKEKPATSILDDRDFILALDTESKPAFENGVPHPINLQIERQLSNSAVVKWSPPSGISSRTVKGYSVYVNGQHRQTVLGSARSKALVSDLNTEESTLISVRTVANDGSESREDEATIVIGDLSEKRQNDQTDKNVGGKLRRRSSDEEIIASFFEQLKRVATKNSPTKSSSSATKIAQNTGNQFSLDGLNKEIPRQETTAKGDVLPGEAEESTKNAEKAVTVESDNEEDPGVFDLENSKSFTVKNDIGQSKTFTTENEDKLFNAEISEKRTFNQTDEVKPEVFNPENMEKSRVFIPENEEKPRIFNPENDGKPRIFNPENEEKPRIFNPENEEKPRVFNPENDPESLQYLDVLQGERIVISDDDLSVIMEETEESTDDVLEPDNFQPELSEKSDEESSASIDGMTNAIRTNTFNPESRSTLVDVTSDNKFKSENQIKPSEEGLLETEAGMMLLDLDAPDVSRQELIGSQETINQLADLTEFSPSVVTPSVEFGVVENPPVDNYTAPGTMIGDRIRESVELLTSETSIKDAKIVPIDVIEVESTPKEHHRKLSIPVFESESSQSDSPDNNGSLFNDSIEAESNYLLNQNDNVSLDNSIVTNHVNNASKETYTISPKQSFHSDSAPAYEVFMTTNQPTNDMCLVDENHNSLVKSVPFEELENTTDKHVVETEAFKDILEDYPDLPPDNDEANGGGLLNAHVVSPPEAISKMRSPNLPYNVTYGNFDEPAFNFTSQNGSEKDNEDLSQDSSSSKSDGVSNVFTDDNPHRFLEKRNVEDSNDKHDPVQILSRSDHRISPELSQKSDKPISYRSDHRLSPQLSQKSDKPTSSRDDHRMLLELSEKCDEPLSSRSDHFVSPEISQKSDKPISFHSDRRLSPGLAKKNDNFIPSNHEHSSSLLSAKSITSVSKNEHSSTKSDNNDKPQPVRNDIYSPREHSVKSLTKNDNSLKTDQKQGYLSSSNSNKIPQVRDKLKTSQGSRSSLSGHSKISPRNTKSPSDNSLGTDTDIDIASFLSSLQSSTGLPKTQNGVPRKSEKDSRASDSEKSLELPNKNTASLPPRNGSKKTVSSMTTNRNASLQGSKTSLREAVSPDLSQATDKDVNSLPSSVKSSPNLSSRRNSLRGNNTRTFANNITVPPNLSNRMELERQLSELSDKRCCEGEHADGDSVKSERKTSKSSLVTTSDTVDQDFVPVDLCNFRNISDNSKPDIELMENDASGKSSAVISGKSEGKIVVSKNDPKTTPNISDRNSTGIQQQLSSCENSLKTISSPSSSSDKIPRRLSNSSNKQFWELSDSSNKPSRELSDSSNKPYRELSDSSNKLSRKLSDSSDKQSRKLSDFSNKLSRELSKPSNRSSQKELNTIDNPEENEKPKRNNIIIIKGTEENKLTDIRPQQRPKPQEEETGITNIPYDDKSSLFHRKSSISSISSQGDSDLDDDSIESEFAISSMKLDGNTKDLSSAVTSTSLGITDDDLSEKIDSNGTADETTDDMNLSTARYRDLEMPDDSETIDKNSGTSDDVRAIVDKTQENPNSNSSPTNFVGGTPKLSRQASSKASSHPSSTSSARRSLKFDQTSRAASDVESDFSEPVKINKPVKHMYSLGGVDDITVSDQPSDDEDFDVTPMGTLDDTDPRLEMDEKQSNLGKIQANIESEDSSRIQVLSLGDVGTSDEPFDDDTLENDVTRDFRIFVALYSYDPITMSPNVDFVDDELAFDKGDLIKIYGDLDEDGFYFGESNGKTGVIPGNMVAEVDTDSHTINSNTTIEDGGDHDVINQSDSFDLSQMLKPSKMNQSDDDAGDLNKSLSSSVPVLSSKQQTTIDESHTSYLPTSYSLPELKNSSEEEDSDGEINNTRKRIDPFKLKPRLMVAMFDYDAAVSSPNVDSEIELSFAAGTKIEIYGEMDEDGFFNGKLEGRKGLVPSNFISDIEIENQVASSQESIDGKPKKKKSNIFKKSKKFFSKMKGK